MTRRGSGRGRLDAGQDRMRVPAGVRVRPTPLNQTRDENHGEDDRQSAQQNAADDAHALQG